MSKLYVTLGLPASGKTTMAKKLVAANGNTIAVCKDDLRPMLFPDRPWSGKREKMVVQMEEAVALSALARGKDVVVHDTSFGHTGRWEALADSHGYRFELIDLTGVPVTECVVRDARRERKVGRDVILNMAARNGLLAPPEKYVLVDLDGTLADITERRTVSLRADGTRDWGLFFDPELVMTDQPRRDIFEKVARERQAGHRVIIVSGRSDRTRHATECWLDRSWDQIIEGGPHRLPTPDQLKPFYDRLIMRPDGDHRPDNELKEWFLDNYLWAGKNCLRAYDDRKRIVSLWRRRGIEVVVCGDLPDGSDF